MSDISKGLKLIQETDAQIYQKVKELKDLMYERRTLMEMIKEKAPDDWLDQFLTTGNPISIEDIEIFI
jgi:hypothetical protein